MDSKVPRYFAVASSDRVSHVPGYPVVVGVRRQPIGTVVSVVVQKPEADGGGVVVMTEAEARAMMQTLQSLLNYG